MVKKNKGNKPTREQIDRALTEAFRKIEAERGGKPYSETPSKPKSRNNDWKNHQPKQK
jgi:hypothetical protein